jgi:thioredoxin-related protein
MNIRRYLLSVISFLLIAALSFDLQAQQGSQQPGAKQKETVKLYDPSLDGMKQISEAVSTAEAGKKHVLIQYGGNWCGWCIRFDAFCKADTAIMKVINNNYVAVKLNYDQANRNDAANEYLGNPVRFGFPVFIILDGNGKVLHIQDSALLEEGQGYSRDKVLGFFRNWTSDAIIPAKKK